VQQQLGRRVGQQLRVEALTVASTAIISLSRSSKSWSLVATDPTLVVRCRQGWI
jgi:hypothetical protein